MSSDQRSDFGVVSDSQEVIQRCRWICTEFGYSFTAWNALEAFLESPDQPRVMIGANALLTKEAAAEAAQAIRFKCRDNSFVVCVVPDRLGKDVAAFVKKSGAHLILLEDELYKTSKLEYACTQVIKADYLPIKVADLMPDRPITFDVYHLLPVRGKFLKFAFEGSDLSSAKIAKAVEVGELYVKKTSAEAFSKYCSTNPDRSAAALARRCRAQFLALYASYTQMVFLLTDQSEHASFQEGEALLKKCKDLAAELMITLGEFGNAWEIVNNTTIGEFGSTERAPAIAAYAALYGLQLDMEGIDDMMIAALLADLGLLLLPPEVSRKIRKLEEAQLTAEERKVYEQYPKISLDIALQRKLPVEEKLRELMISTLERYDGQGFPRRLQARKLTEQMQLIHFCRIFDQRTIVMLGRPRPDRDEARKQIIEEELANPSRFNPVFMNKLRRTFYGTKGGA